MSLLAEGGNPKSKGGTAVDVFVTESVKEVIDEMLNERKSLVDKITKENKKFKEQASQNLLKLATFVSDDEVAFQDLPFGTDQETSGSTQVKAVRMPAVTFPPKYVTWVNVAKNELMAEDQSILGQRRLYYDEETDETTFCSDSDEEYSVEEKWHYFTPLEDAIISKCVHKFEKSAVLLREISRALKIRKRHIDSRIKELEEQNSGIIPQPLELLAPYSFPKTNYSMTPGTDFVNFQKFLETLVTNPEEKENSSKVEEFEKFPEDLNSAMENFDTLFCRRCLEKKIQIKNPKKWIEKLLKVFDCRRHTIFKQPDPSVRPPAVSIQKTGACGENCGNFIPGKGFVETKYFQSDEELSQSGSEKNSENEKEMNGEKELEEIHKDSEGTEKDRKSTAGNDESETEGDEPSQGGKVAHSQPASDSWANFEVDLLRNGIEMFGPDSCTISETLLAGYKTCAEITKEIPHHTDLIELSQKNLLQSQKASRRRKHHYRMVSSRRTDRAKVRNLIPPKKKAGNKGGKKGGKEEEEDEEGGKPKRVLPRHYSPCDCTGQCLRATCRCQINGTLCEKFCGCSKSCRYRFEGCKCTTTTCSPGQCTCIGADRECDPDVCKNCKLNCGDGSFGFPLGPSFKTVCQNMKVSLRDHPRILLGKSDVHGWGAFLKSPLEKNQFVGEYTGEMISHLEADRRGKVYDRVNYSYLFDLNSQYVLDAFRKGNKLKFANHSSEPNCQAKLMIVGGDQRVAIFSKKKINAGEELFYDYGYSKDIAPKWWPKHEKEASNRPQESLHKRNKKTFKSKEK